MDGMLTVRELKKTLEGFDDGWVCISGNGLASDRVILEPGANEPFVLITAVPTPKQEEVMKAGDDPRPDQSKDGPTYPNPPDNSNPRPAPGGVGTGTETDPSRHTPEKK